MNTEPVRPSTALLIGMAVGLSVVALLMALFGQEEATGRVEDGALPYEQLQDEGCIVVQPEQLEEAEVEGFGTFMHPMDYGDRGVVFCPSGTEYVLSE